MLPGGRVLLAAQRQGGASTTAELSTPRRSLSRTAAVLIVKDKANTCLSESPRPARVGVVRSADTSVVARAMQLSVYRRLSPSERVAIALSMSEDVRAIAEAGATYRSGVREGEPGPGR